MLLRQTRWFAAGSLLSAEAFADERVTTAAHTAPIDVRADPTPQLQPIRIAAGGPEGRGVRVRGGLTLLTIGWASNFQSSGTGAAGGGGVGFRIGAQFSSLVGAYVRGSVHTLIYLTHAEADMIVDFTLIDRIQFGGGIGVFILADPFVAGSSSGGGLVFPLHFGVTPVLFRMRDGTRTGLHITTDLAPGTAVAPYPYRSSRFALSATLAIGWEWY